MSSSGKTVRNQFDNSINSKQAGAGRASAVLVWGVIILVAALAGLSALTLPPPLTGRLHPGHVPAALALACLAAGLIAGVRAMSSRGGDAPDPDCLPTPAPSVRVIAAAVAAVIMLALGTRALGVLPAVFAAGTFAALGVRGVSLVRAGLTGAGLAGLAALVFVLALRQPLPLLPGVW